MRLSYRPTLLLFGFLFLTLATGCAFHGLPDIEDDPGIVKMIDDNKKPIPFVVGVAFPRLAFDPDDINTVDKGARRWAQQLSTEAAQDQLVKQLEKYSLFKQVVALPDSGGSHQKDMANAFRRKCQIVLTMDYKKAETSFEGVNWKYYLNLINWINFIPASWIVADEEYGYDAVMEVGIYATDSEENIERKTIKMRDIKSFDDFDRGWQLMGILRIPDSLEPDNWKEIWKVLEPHLLQKAEQEVLKFCHKDARSLLEGISKDKNIQAKFNKTLTLSIGVSKFGDERIMELPAPAGDARRFHHMLIAPEFAAVPAKNSRFLIDEEATKNRILNELGNDFLAGRSSGNDSCVIYFSGYGAVAPNGKSAYLIPFNAEKKNLAQSAISIADLSKAIKRIKARDIYLVLDASFGGGEGGRSLVLGGPKVDRATIVSLLKPLYGKGRTVILAAQPGETAFDYGAGEVPEGTFTHFMLEGARKKGMKSERLARTLTGTFDHANRWVPEWTMLMHGEDQQPIILGEPKGEIKYKGKKGPRQTTRISNDKNPSGL